MFSYMSPYEYRAIVSPQWILVLVLVDRRARALFPNFYYETFQARRNIENRCAMSTQLDPTVVPFYCMCFITNVSLFPSLYLSGSEPGATLLLGGHLALSGSLFLLLSQPVCVGENLISILQPTGRFPTTKHSLAPSVNNAEVEKHGSLPIR